MPRPSTITSLIECTNCGKDRVQKAGMCSKPTGTAARQRYRCLNCGSYFMNDLLMPRTNVLQKKLAIILYIAGANITDICTTTGFTFPTISGWIEDMRKHLEESSPDIDALRRPEHKHAWALNDLTGLDVNKRYLFVELDPIHTSHVVLNIVP
jgi:transposase-like protein